MSYTRLQCFGGPLDNQWTDVKMEWISHQSMWVIPSTVKIGCMPEVYLKPLQEMAADELGMDLAGSVETYFSSPVCDCSGHEIRKVLLHASLSDSEAKQLLYDRGVVGA